MRVLLAYRSHEDGAEPEGLTLPAGLVLQDADLRESGYRPSLANFSRLGWRDVQRYLDEQAPDVIAVSMMTPNRRVAARLIRLARRTCPEALTVAGGPHARALAGPLLERVRELDAVVLEEGVGALGQLCAAFGAARRRPVDAVPGVLTRTRPAARRRSGFVRLPRLEATLRDLDAAGVEPVRDLRWVVASLRTGDAVHHREPEDVAADVADLRSVLGLVDVTVLGPGLAAERHRLGALSAALLRRKAGASWELCAEPEDLVPVEGAAGDERALRAALRMAHRAGCRGVHLAVDAGGIAGRGLELTRLLAHAGEELRRSGLDPVLTLRVGVPDQDPAHLESLRQLVRALRPRRARIEPRLALPDPGPVGSADEAKERAQPWFEDERGLIPAAGARQLELASRSLEVTLRDVCRSARTGPRDLEVLRTRSPDDPWVEIAWGDYRAGHDDPREAERHYRRAAALEPSNPHPWLRLAVLAERSGDAGLRVAALREVLGRVPRHEGARTGLRAGRRERSRNRRRG